MGWRFRNMIFSANLDISCSFQQKSFWNWTPHTSISVGKKKTEMCICMYRNPKDFTKSPPYRGLAKSLLYVLRPWGFMKFLLNSGYMKSPLYGQISPWTLQRFHFLCKTPICRELHKGPKCFEKSYLGSAS